MAQGNVEVWLGSLLTASLNAVHAVIKQASVAVSDPNFELMEFENTFPAQVSTINGKNNTIAFETMDYII